MRFRVKLTYETNPSGIATSILGLEDVPTQPSVDFQELVEPPSFSPVAATAWPRAAGVALSLSLHLLAIASVPVLTILFYPLPTLVPVRLVRYESLRIRIPERNHLAAHTPMPRLPSRSRPAPASPSGSSAGKPTARAPKLELPAERIEAARASAAQPNAAQPEAAQPSVPSSPRRIVELPPMQAKPRVEFTLIQPNIPVTQPAQLSVPPPQVILWSAAQDKPKRPLKEFVMPGHASKTPETPALDAPPELARPNREIEVAQLRFAGAAATAAPALPVRPSTTAPLRRFTPPPKQAATRPPSLDPFAGEQALVISLPDRTQPLPDVLNIPAGNQIARPQAPGPVQAAAKTAGGSSGNGAGSSSSAAGRESTARGALAGSGTASGSGNSAGNGAGPGSGIGAGNSPSGTARSSGGVANGADDGLRLASTYSHPIRVEHPENAMFDIVVVGAADNKLDGVNLLSGSPIYTVHLRVGAPRSWMMQYCVPNQKGAAKSSGSVVTLTRPAPVRAPYPRITIVPPKELYPATDRITIHGYIGTTGTFHDLRVISGHQAASTANILPLLDAWQFRPAGRDGVPLEVEMVLVILPTNAISK